MVIKMNVPKLRFKKFTMEWEYKIFDDLITNKSNIYNIQKDSNNYKCIELENIKPNLGMLNGYFNSVDQKSSKNYFFKNEILFGKLRPYLKKYWFAKFDGVCSTEFWVLKSKDTQKITNKFLYYIIQSNYFLQLCNLSTGSKMPRADWSYIKEQSIAIPILSEQEKIANTLELLDKKIELQLKKIEALKLYKKGLINLVKSDWKSWKNYKIKDIFKITRGVVIPKNKLSEEKNEIYKYPVYSSQTSNNGILGYDKIYDYNGKYLTWTTDGANAGKVFYRDGKFRCTNVCGILYEDNPLFTNEFVCDLLNYETPKHVSYVGNPKLMNNVMENINLKLPNNDILIKTSKLISLINKKVENETNKLMKLHNLKKGLIQNMFV